MPNKLNHYTSRQRAHHNFLAQLQEENNLLKAEKDQAALLIFDLHNNIAELETVRDSLNDALKLLQASEKQLVLWLNILLVVCVVLFATLMILLTRM